MHHKNVLSIAAAMLISTYGQAVELNTLLDLKLDDLGEIDIVNVQGASKIEQRSIDAPANITVITSDDIKRHNYRTVADVLAAQSGFYKSYDRDYAYIGVRGFSSPGDYSTKVLMVIDGQRVNENLYSSSTFGDLSYVDIDMIERIELIRGPGSALYGSSAIFAVINIITKDSAHFKNGEVSVLGGNNATDKERITLSHIFDNDAAILVSASRYHSDGDDNLYYEVFDDPATNNGYAEDLDSHDGRALLFKGKVGRFTAQAIYYKRDKDVPTAAWDTAFNAGINSQDEQAFVSLKYQDSVADNIKLNAQAAYTDYHYEGTYPYEDPGIVIGFDGADSRWLDGSVDVTYYQSDSLNWLLGVYAMDSLEEKQIYEYDGVTYLDVDEPVDLYSAYLQNIFHATRNLSFTVGARYDRYDSIGGNISPKVSAVYAFSPVSSLKAIYGEAFRAPNAYELYYHDGNFFQKGNPDLDEEKIRNFELVFEHYFSTGHYFKVNGFYYEMKNLIQQTTDIDDGLLVFRNLSEAESSGVELSYNYLFENGIDTSVNYTYQNSEDKESGASLSNSPEHLANASVTVPFSSRFESTVSLQHVGEKKNPYGETLDDYTIANLSINGFDVLKGLDLSAAVYNLFDTTYSSSGGEEHYQKEIIQDGIMFRLKATYEF